MEPASGKPVRRRRRWLIVAAVLVLVSMVSWWHWPRGDARFVGRWHFHAEGDSTTAEMVLRRNGGGYLHSSNGITMSFPWSVSHDRLIIGSNSAGVFARVRGYLAEWLMTWTESTFLSTEQSYPVIDCGADAIRLREGSQVMILRRIPE
jgi:hypothetical protein